MPHTANNIFNRKLLDTAIKNFDFSKIKDLQQKKDILLRWENTIESNVLKNVAEISLDGTFINNIFSEVLGYKNITQNNNAWNLNYKQKTKQDATRADGALGFFIPSSEDIRAIIELKSSGTDLDSKQIRTYGKITPIEQAFSYVPKSGKKCRWVIVSNFLELRLYNAKSSLEYERFNIANLVDENKFKRFYYLLSSENLILKDHNSLIDSLYLKNEAEEENISKKFYSEYKYSRIHLFEHIKKNNPDRDDIFLLEKTQKLLDRFIFVCFCEDTYLLPERIFRKVVNHAKESLLSEKHKIWTELKGLFRAIDKGAPPHKITAFNGGLFAEDLDLDSLIIDDEIFEELSKITDYDFSSDLNVNILGHIFEQSISDIEEFKAEIKGLEIEKRKGKRKKEGIYYTPSYITKYIVENAIGGWLEDRKKELGKDSLPELTEKDYKSIKYLKTKKVTQFNKKIEQYIGFWEAYKDKLANIKILDPACGSGAFLNQAFDFLYKEGQKVNSILAKYRGRVTKTFFDLDKHILSNNLFGVDLNEESVEITKLSLWLKTANKKSELTALDNNIKCGNSLIEDTDIAGNKAFKWVEEFAGIMDNEGFDVVIGNPPYVKARDNEDKISRKFIGSKYATAYKMWDIYIPFIEQGMYLLNRDGKLCMIIPDTLGKAEYTNKIVNLIENKYELAQIDFFRGIYVFKNIGVKNKIILINKTSTKNKTTRVLHHNNISNISYLPSVEGKDKYLIETAKFKIDLSNTLEFSDICFISYGLRLNSHKNDNDFKFKKNNLLSPIKTDNYNRIYTEGKFIDRYVILHEFFVEWGTDRCPKRLVRPTFPELYPPDKLLMSREKKITTLSDKGHVCDNTIIMAILAKDLKGINNNSLKKYFNNIQKDRELIEKNSKNFDLKFLLAIVNSKLISYYIKYKCKERIDFYPDDWKKIPIKNIPIADQQPFIEKAERLLELNKQLYEKAIEFNDFFESKYKLKKIPNKLLEFYRISFDEFLRGLKKQKVSVTVKEEYEIKSLFKEQKEKSLNIKFEIERIDKELDLMIYKLYGLTEEEIKIVEES